MDHAADRPAMTLTSTVLESTDPRALAAFYRHLLGWPVSKDGPTWVTLRPDGSGAGLSFQLAQDHIRPTWPPLAGEQQMMAHLDIEVEDLEAAVAHAVAAGATVADFQPRTPSASASTPTSTRSACSSRGSGRRCADGAT